MRVIGLTGGAGSGKSYVAGVVTANFPILHINTDDIARRQMLKGGASYAAVVEEFGPDIVGPDGEIDRAALASIVFNDEKKLEKLNSLTHPNVTAEVHRIIGIVDRGEVQSSLYDRPVPYRAVLVETAILKEAGYEAFCDDIWYVRAPREDRIGRLMKTRGYSRERAEATLASQASEEEFEAYCTGIIDNPDSMNGMTVLRQVAELLNN